MKAFLKDILKAFLGGVGYALLGFAGSLVFLSIWCLFAPPRSMPTCCMGMQVRSWEEFREWQALRIDGEPEPREDRLTLARELARRQPDKGKDRGPER